MAGVAVERFGKVDILINVVGAIRSKQLYTPFLEMTEQQWDDTFALNLKPGFHLIRKLAPGMLERSYGKIVNISSIVYAGEPGQSDYAAAKAAVASWTRSLAGEFAPHVNVNCIAPGIIRTSVTERIGAEDARRLTAASFLKRFGEAREIADVACFLASDEASFVTGEIIAVSGNHPCFRRAQSSLRLGARWVRPRLLLRRAAVQADCKHSTARSRQRSPCKKLQTCRPMSRSA